MLIDGFNNMNGITIKEWCEYVKRDYRQKVYDAVLRKYDGVSKDMRISLSSGLHDLAEVLREQGHTGRGCCVKAR